MSHIWKPSNAWGKPVMDTCERCLITRSSMFYSNLPGGLIGKSQRLVSIEKEKEPDCDQMILRRVMLS
jgi:hypothetical protein